MNHTIYTIGYARLSPARLKEIAEARDALVVDIRYSPRSRRPEWNRDALENALPEDYMWCQDLGNVNFAGNGPIKLKNPDAAASGLADILTVCPIILLCQCLDWRECHRRVAAEYLGKALGAPVEHLEPDTLSRPGMFKALSLTPPYGSLIAAAAEHPELGKRIETRGWPTSYRGPLAIHQTKGLADTTERELAGMCQREPFKAALAAIGIARSTDLPRGAIVAVCDLVDCIPTNHAYQGMYGRRAWELPGEPDLSFGNYDLNRYAWKLENIRRLAEPIPARGYQGLWDFEAAQIEAALLEASAA